VDRLNWSDQNGEFTENVRQRNLLLLVVTKDIDDDVSIGSEKLGDDVLLWLPQPLAWQGDRTARHARVHFFETG
jgi:hypothetical protein